MSKKYVVWLTIGLLSTVGFLLLDSNTILHYRKVLSAYWPELSIHSEEEEEGGIPLRDRIDLYWQQETERTKDPATGTVPRERLLKAMEYMSLLQQQQSSNRMMGAIAGINWYERGPKNCGGRTRAIMVDPNDATRKTIWAGGVGGGLWRTTDITATTPNWAAVDDMMANLAVTTICYNPANTQIFYAGTGEGYSNADAIRGLGIWKSINGGATWSQLASTNNANFYYVNRMVVHASGDVYAATNSGLFRSQDGGTTWIKVLGAGTGAATNNISDVETGADNSIWASTRTNGEIYRSPNGNAGSYIKLNTGANGFPATGASRIDFALAPSNSAVAYAYVAEGGGVNFYRTDDTGANWTLLPKPVDADGGIGNDITRGQFWYDMSIAVDPNNSNHLYVGGVDLFKSSNGGSSWQQVAHWYGGFGFQEVHADQHIALFEGGNSNVIYFGNDGGIYRSGNATAAIPSIEFKSDNYNVTQFYACAIHPTAYTNYFLAGAQDNGSHQYNNGGINATVEVTGGDGCFTHIDQNEPQYQFTSYVYNNFYRSTNGGATFAGVNTTGGSFVNPSDYDNSANIMYAYSSSGTYVRWTNATTGATFQTVALSAGLTGTITAITVSPNTANRVFMGVGSGKVVRVDNANTVASGSAGVQINNGAGMPTGSISCIEVETGNDNHIIVTYFNYGVNSVWETTNGGTSWTSIEGNLPDMPIRWALFNPNNNQQVMLATELGVWTTDLLNGAATNWGPSNNGMANVCTHMLQLRASDKIVIAATHGRGLFTTDAFADPYPEFLSDKRITYLNKPIQFTDASYKSTAWEWDFGDGTNASVKNPVKSYTTPGIYTVTLKINNNNSLIATKTTYIQILPNRGTPYTLASGGNFDTNPNEFGPDNTSGTPWQRGNSAIAGKNGTNSGSFAWVTGLSAANYANYTDASLMTPNYNFSAAGTYTLKFYRKNSFESGYDGMRVEYSFNKGDSWIPLGIVAANWYDFANTASATSFPINEPYFNVTKSAYTLCQYDVSFLAGNPNVAFRIRFKSDNSVTAVGAAIDDFEILAPNNNPLPVQLVALTGKAFKDYNAIEWTTASERNNKGFFLERSLDKMHFEDLSFIQGQGSTTNINNYHYQDDDVKNEGIYFYRLRQTDFDGKSFLSPIITIERKSEFTPIIVNPNPASQTITVANITGQNTLIRIYDRSAAMVFERSIKSSASSTCISLSDLKILPGIYFIEVIDDGRKFSQRLIKL
jgi:PKD repeat protein